MSRRRGPALEAGVERANLLSAPPPGWRATSSGALRPADDDLRTSTAGHLQGAASGRKGWPPSPGFEALFQIQSFIFSVMEY